MAEGILNEFWTLMNYQREQQELLREALSKATALMKVALDDNFLDNSSVTLYYYLWAVEDVMGQAMKINEGAIAKSSSLMMSRGLNN